MECGVGFTEKLPNGKFRACWHDPSGKQRSLTFDLERDAKKHVRNAQADIDRGVYVDDKTGRVSFGELAEHYMTLAEKRLARTGYARDRSYLDNHVLPRWGKVKLGRINHVDVDRCIAERAHGSHITNALRRLGRPVNVHRTLHSLVAAL